jgi:hypothetical protein
MIIFLDTAPLWTICHQNSGNEGKALRTAVASRLLAGHTVAIAEINDYEARRELLRRNAKVQLARLDQLVEQSSYYPIDTELMRALPCSGQVCGSLDEPAARRHPCWSSGRVHGCPPRFGSPNRLVFRATVLA